MEYITFVIWHCGHGHDSLQSIDHAKLASVYFALSGLTLLLFQHPASSPFPPGVGISTSYSRSYARIK